MIETKKVRGGIELDIICDKCGKGDSYDGDDFKGCMDQIKLDKRKASNVGGIRVNICPDCKPTNQFIL